MWNFWKTKKHQDSKLGAIPSSNRAIVETFEIDQDENSFSEKDQEKTIERDVRRKTTIFQPTAFSTIKPIVDELMQQRVVLLDLSKLPDKDRLRTIDFITGVMYALNGEYTKIDNKVYKFIVRK